MSHVLTHFKTLYEILITAIYEYLHMYRIYNIIRKPQINGDNGSIQVYNYTSKLNLVHMCYETLLVFQELYSIALASSNVYFIFEKLITTNCFDCNFNWFKLPLKLQSQLNNFYIFLQYIHILTDISTRMESNIPIQLI